LGGVSSMGRRATDGSGAVTEVLIWALETVSWSEVKLDRV
jgi:hypothetical protein